MDQHTNLYLFRENNIHENEKFRVQTRKCYIKILTFFGILSLQLISYVKEISINSLKLGHEQDSLAYLYLSVYALDSLSRVSSLPQKSQFLLNASFPFFSLFPFFLLLFILILFFRKCYFHFHCLNFLFYLKCFSYNVF